MKLHFLTTNTEIINQVKSFIKEWENSSEFIYTNTSGSTGKPKSIKIQKRHMMVSARTTGEFLNLKNGQSALLSLSPNTIGGKMMIVRSIVLGLTLYVIEPSANPMKSLTERFDFVALVPLQLFRILKETPKRLNQIKQLIIGGGPMSDQLIKDVQMVSVRIFHSFGMTETISHFALKSINQPYNKSYKLLPGVSINTLNDHLIVNWPAIGVTNLKTNDIISITNDSFTWHGRADFVINSGGVKLHPESIESKLYQVISTVFFSAGLPDYELGEKHVLCIEGEVVNYEKTEFSSVLGKYEIPKEIIFLSAFKYTESGKINRVETLKLIHNGTRQVL
ncbi:MAG: AMP-binding protein [Crocinitomicaceae bacterium]|nr:AMP-binding protein [Crocinitomicaceae bacterium]